MKKATKIFLIILVVLVIASSLIAIYQWDNIIAFYIAKTYSKEEIEEMSQNNTALRKEAASDLDVRELTEDEREAIKNGEIGSSEALERILNTGNNETEDSSDKSVATGSRPPKRDYDAELSELIGQVYVLEASFSGALDNLVSSAIAEYKALPVEQHTETEKWRIGLKYLGTATSMEASCDQQMATILSQVESVLVASGGDMERLQQIKSAYANEKIVKKDYYLSLNS